MRFSRSGVQGPEHHNYITTQGIDPSETNLIKQLPAELLDLFAVLQCKSDIISDEED